MEDGDGCTCSPIRCPFGFPGDRLWVRETFRVIEGRAEFAASTHSRANVDWKPSIFMPRVLSRITLEVTDVRVERLQEMTEADAQAEGFSTIWPFNPNVGEFYLTWNKLNGKRGFSWESNPWVWVISFRRLEVKHGEG